MYARLLLFSLMIFVPTWVDGRDCDSSDGYIRDHQGNVTDNCDYECGWMQCGDICINAFGGRWCFCVRERLWLISGEYHCCVDQSPDNRTQCHVHRDGNGHCPQGRVVNKTETCNNHCYNDYETSAVVGGKSRYRCNDQKCVSAQLICLGFPLRRSPTSMQLMKM